MSEPYRPANGTEGCMFEARFCDQCEHDRLWRENDMEHDSCSIHCWAVAVDIDHPKYPPEWIVDEHGARCTAFQPEADKLANQEQPQ